MLLPCPTVDDQVEEILYCTDRSLKFKMVKCLAELKGSNSNIQL